MKLKLSEGQYVRLGGEYTHFEIEDYQGNTLFEVNLDDYEVADIDERDGHDVVRIQLNNTVEETPQERLEYLRELIKNEKISYGEIVELQSLVEYIEPGDVELLEWAGVEE